MNGGLLVLAAVGVFAVWKGSGCLLRLVLVAVVGAVLLGQVAR